MAAEITVQVDRDSVAAGDDTRSHAYSLTVEEGTPLSGLLERASPEIRQIGWSWVAFADGSAVAVWSVDHGVQMLVPDVPMTGRKGPLAVDFRYFQQIDPAWLHRRLAEGAPADVRVLGPEYRPIARAAEEREDRRREQELAKRLLTSECVAAVESLGSRTDLHNDRLYRFDLLGQRWVVRRYDTMTKVFRGDGSALASLRPTTFAECWLVAAVAGEVRVSSGLPLLPPFDPHPAPELKPMVAQPSRWSTHGELTAQLTGETAVSCFRIAVGRSIDEILRLMAP